MKLKKALKLSLGVLVSFPLSFFVGNELLANNFTERVDFVINNDSLLACGGGGGGGKTPAERAEAKKKKAKAKLSFKKRALSKAAAAWPSAVTTTPARAPTWATTRWSGLRNGQSLKLDSTLQTWI